MPQGMEPETKKYLLKVLNSFAVGMLWLTLNVLGGLYWGFGIVEKRLSVYNILYFIWFLSSLSGLLYYYYSTWKK